MNESNELNDIILNKGSSTNNNKKIILAVATLGVILIVVVMLMNSITSNGTDNLPQTPIPPKVSVVEEPQEEILFEEVEILEEETQNNNDLDAIAARLKAESLAQLNEEVVIIAEPIIEKPKVVAKVVAKPSPEKTAIVTSPSSSKVYYYIQVGSFSKYAPNKKFLKSITDLGYKYKFHKIVKKSKTINKVLVGPFKSSNNAKDARRVLRAKIEPGAFLIKL
ncbi:MAG: SPOR domain-containing protein [Sulfurimonas sp.]|nr:SPOR domain-containing protein [Sulfurimonas sp.]MDQ7062144.1 SPOR domain-containing protein [Sulfurimonas sp.]